MEQKWNRFCRVLNIGMFMEHDGILECAVEELRSHPVYCCESLRKKLIQGAHKQSVPYIYQDEYQVCFVCVKNNREFYMAGPMSMQVLGRIELHRFYRSYGIEKEYERPLKHFLLAQILDVVNLMTQILYEAEYSDDELLYGNHLINDNRGREKKEKVLFDLKKDEEDLYHHTYVEERVLLDSVKEGRVQDALRHTRNLDSDLGKLSSRELNHWRNVMIVGITLCTRAAIEGGLSPSVAYRLSDFYIQKGDGCTEIAQFLECRNQAVEDLASRVAEKKEKRSRYNYVERCKDYVEQNYRKKIYLGDIAAMLGISESYLSRLFRKEEGAQLQEYITKIRIEHAANLLVYSDESLARIAEYVGFPTQSYMGKMFKKYKNTSPRQYREKNKPADF